MAKIEIDLTEEQLEKVKQLEANDISVGDAIDMLFDVKKEAFLQMEDIDEKITLLDKIKETAWDVEVKAAALDDNYSDSEKTYDRAVQDTKHRIKWGKDFFKF